MVTSKDFKSLIDWCAQPSEDSRFTNVVGACLVADCHDPEFHPGQTKILGAWDGYLGARATTSQTAEHLLHGTRRAPGGTLPG